MPYIAVAAIFDDSVTIIDVTNPAAPTFAGNLRGAGPPNHLIQVVVPDGTYFDLNMTASIAAASSVLHCGGGG